MQDGWMKRDGLVCVFPHFRLAVGFDAHAGKCAGIVFAYELDLFFTNQTAQIEAPAGVPPALLK